MTVDDQMYARVFENHAEGKVILEDLVAKFARNPYVRGGADAARETDYRAGQLSVVTHIVDRVNRAAGVAVPEEPT